MNDKKRAFKQVKALLMLFFSYVSYDNGIKCGHGVAAEKYKKKTRQIRFLNKIDALNKKNKIIPKKDLEELKQICLDPDMAIIFREYFHIIPYSDWYEKKKIYDNSFKLIEFFYGHNKSEVEDGIHNIEEICKMYVDPFVTDSLTDNMVKEWFDDIMLIVKKLMKHTEEGTAIYAWMAYQFCRFHERDFPEWLLNYFDSAARDIYRIMNGDKRDKNDLEQALHFDSRRDFARHHNFELKFTVLWLLDNNRHRADTSTANYMQMLADFFSTSFESIKNWDSQTRRVLNDISQELLSDENFMYKLSLLSH